MLKRRRKRHIRSGIHTSCKVEQLEPRLALTTTLYIDFGLGFARDGSGALQTTEFHELDDASELRDVNSGTMDTGPDICAFNSFDPNQPNNVCGNANAVLDEIFDPTDSVRLFPLREDLDGIGGVTGDDIALLSSMFDEIKPIIDDALLAYDVDVQLNEASDLADVQTKLDNGAAYVFVIDGGLRRSAADPFEAFFQIDDDFFGLAGANDIGSSVNSTADVAFAFAKAIYEDANPPAFAPLNDAAFVDRFAHRLAYTITHEAFHTFTLSHVGSSFYGYEDGDVIVEGIHNSDLGRETRPLVTRRPSGDWFDEFGDNHAKTINALGERDQDGNGTFDFQVVTGTGGYDKIDIVGDGTTATVTVTSYWSETDDGMTFPPFEQPNFGGVLGTTISYTIDDLASHDKILVDGHLYDDRITLSGYFEHDIEFLIRGSHGDDLVVADFTSGPGSSPTGGVEFLGESGSNTLTVLEEGSEFSFTGGEGDDTYNGGSFGASEIHDTLGDDKYYLWGELAVAADTIYKEMSDTDGTVFFSRDDQIIRFVLDGQYAGCYIGQKGEELSLDATLPNKLADLQGDVNLDCRTNEDDFFIISNNLFTNPTTRATGDLNGDGSTDGSDFNLWNSDDHKELSSPVEAIIALASGPAGQLNVAEESLDLVDDGEIKLGGPFGTDTGSDLKAYLDSVGMTLGDADLDGLVNAYDFDVVMKYANQTGTTWRTGDFNGDSVTNIYDYVIWYNNRTDPTINGDLSFDGAVGVADINEMFEALAILQDTSASSTFQSTLSSMYDLNSDGTIDQLDADYLVETILGTAYGDANLDGLVNSADLNTVVINLDTYVDSWADGDFNGDGIVNDDDLALVILNWGFGL